MDRCQRLINSNDILLKPIAQEMKNKLEQYRNLTHSCTLTSARICDPRISNDAISDGDFLRSIIDVPVCQLSEDQLKKITILDEILDDIGCSNMNNDEITQFMRVSAVGDKGLDQMLWWKANCSRFPSIARLAADCLSSQSTSVASESEFSRAGNLINDKRTCLSDLSIKASMLLRSWLKLLH